MATNVIDIVAKIKELSLVEAAELVKAIEEEFGVSAASVVAGPAVAGPAAAAEPEKDSFKIELLEAGEKKIDVIKKLREAAVLLGITLGLKEAKDFAENTPSAPFDAVAKDNAKKIKDLLESVGAKVKLS